MPPPAELARTLVAWFRHAPAALPWRATRDPYRVWLSEIMLQQTQIASVIPYYERFVAVYPTVQDLAGADLQSVLKLWEGLGYYSRARNLHKAAQIVAYERGGVFPENAEGLLALPGIGPYTAGAIASIVYGEAVPVLDGNVIRVLTRLYDISDEVGESAVQKRLWDLAASLVPSESPGDYNQAIMELGQTLCKPKNPLCVTCPVAALCLARARGTQNERPVKRAKAPIPHYNVAAGLVRDAQNRLLIAQRPTDKWLGGLWEFPGGKQEADESLPACLARELAEELAIQVEVGEFFARVQHAFTHFKITLHAYHCRYLPEGGPPQALGCAAWCWVTENELENYPFGAADRQIIAELGRRKHQLL